MLLKKKEDIVRYIEHYEKLLSNCGDPNEIIYLEKEVEKLRKKLIKLEGK